MQKSVLVFFSLSKICVFFNKSSFKSFFFHFASQSFQIDLSNFENLYFATTLPQKINNLGQLIAVVFQGILNKQKLSTWLPQVFAFLEVSFLLVVIGVFWFVRRRDGMRGFMSDDIEVRKRESRSLLSGTAIDVTHSSLLADLNYGRT